MYRILLIVAIVFMAVPVWGRRNKNVLRAHLVEEPTAIAADDTVAPTLMVVPIEVNMDSVPSGDCDGRDMLPSPVLEAEMAVINANMSILGRAVADAERLYRFVLTRNPDFSREIAETFISVGERYGIRGDVALCQSIIETGWFMFAGGTAVTPDQHNYCGLGVTKLGMKGHSFKTVADGVTAQFQHLYAYATRKPLPKGEKIVDPRFKLVSRGCAPTWTGLNGRWAANKNYAESIMRIYKQMLEFDFSK